MQLLGLQDDSRGTEVIMGTGGIQMSKLIIITTMHDLPEGCYDNCPLCHDGYCLGLSVSDSGWPYQPAQEVRPYNCPLKIKETD